MEGVSTSEKSVKFWEKMRLYIPEDCHFRKQDVKLLTLIKYL
jgi:hypothetical protein